MYLGVYQCAFRLKSAASLAQEMYKLAYPTSRSANLGNALEKRCKDNTHPLTDRVIPPKKSEKKCIFLHFSSFFCFIWLKSNNIISQFFFCVKARTQKKRPPPGEMGN